MKNNLRRFRKLEYLANRDDHFNYHEFTTFLLIGFMLKLYLLKKNTSDVK